MHRLLLALGFYTLLANSGLAQPSEPLSVIDWLSDSVTPAQLPDTTSKEPATATSAKPAAVQVTPLDRPTPDAAGVFAPSLLKLPDTMWSFSDEQTMVDLVSSIPNPQIPALQDLLVTLLLIEAKEPFGATAQGRFFLSRVDKLLEFGRLEEAGALLSSTQLNSPEIFRRRFDVALLTGTEDAPCNLISQTPNIAPSYSARIYCLARVGDWPAAALTLNTRRALGDLSDEDDALFSAFLDPEVMEHAGRLPDPEKVTPLVYRIREAVGESLPTIDLPIAFAHADLRSVHGWRTQLNAAERLIRYGAIEPTVFRVLFTSRRPSASGGIWDQVEAIRSLQDAVNKGELARINASLPAAYIAATELGAEALISELFANELKRYDLTDEAARIAATMHFINSNGTPPTAPDIDPFLVSIANGYPQEILVTEPKQLAVQTAFNGRETPSYIKDLLDQGKVGEALVHVFSLAQSGLDGDLAAMSDALTVLRAVGLDDTARKVSLQYLMMERF